MLAAALCGCSTSPRFDSCSRLREFKEFNFRPAWFQSLPRLEVTALPPQVHASVAALSRRLVGNESFFIVSARESGPYILLELSEGCFDCKRWVVYSPKRECIVGVFTVGGQG